MIFHLTLTTTELLGGNTAEWQAFEKCVRLRFWTSGPRTDEGRLRQLKAELLVPLRVEGGPVVRARCGADAWREVAGRSPRCVIWSPRHGD